MHPNHVGYWIVGAVGTGMVVLYVVLSIFRLLELIEALEEAPPDEEDGVEEIIAKLTFALGVDTTKAMVAIEQANRALCAIGKASSVRVTDEGVVVVTLYGMDEDELAHLDHGASEVGTRTIPELLRAAGLEHTPGPGTEKWSYAPTDHMGPDVEPLSEAERVNYASHEVRTGVDLDDGGYEMCVLCQWAAESLYEAKCPGRPIIARDLFEPRD